MNYRCVETEEEALPESSPERRLLTAILELACRDLSYDTQLKQYSTNRYLNRKRAVAWFNSGETFDPSGLSFTFEEIKSELNLSAKRSAFLMQKVKAAEKVLKIEEDYIKRMVQENEEKDKCLCER